MMRRSTRTRVIIAAMIVASIAAACSDPSPGAAPTSGSVPPSPGAGERWLAAVEVAPRADDLDRATERLRDVLGPALVVSPVDCFEGLPPEAGDDGYVIGALADSATQAQGLIENAGEGALFIAQVTIVCPD